MVGEPYRGANGRFYKLLNYGKQYLFDDVVMDYFAVLLPDLLIWDGDLNVANRIHCKFMLALGYCGLGKKEEAMKYMEEVEMMDRNHIGVKSVKWMMQGDDIGTLMESR